MKTTTFLRTAIALSTVLILNSCNKSITSPPAANIPLTKQHDAFEVEYRISPVPGYLASIIYADSTGNQVTIYNPAEFVNGSKKITVSGHFNAFLSTKIFNVSGTTVNFSMTIYVDGEIKENTNCSVKSGWPNPGSINTLEYEVQ